MGGSYLKVCSCCGNELNGLPWKTATDIPTEETATDCTNCADETVGAATCPLTGGELCEPEPVYCPETGLQIGWTNPCDD